jgi:hypothetical protein
MIVKDLVRPIPGMRYLSPDAYIRAALNGCGRRLRMANGWVTCSSAERSFTVLPLALRGPMVIFRALLITYRDCWSSRLPGLPPGRLTNDSKTSSNN